MLRFVYGILSGLAVLLLLVGCGGPDLTGKWEQTGSGEQPPVTSSNIMECVLSPADQYEFRDGSKLLTANFAGKYEVVDSGRLKMSDDSGMLSMVVYFTLTGDNLTLKMGENCREYYYKRTN